MYAIRNSLLATLILSAGTMLAPLAGTAGENWPTQPPPPNQPENTPAPKLGQVWDAGHWEWNGHAYWWRRGAWRDPHRTTLGCRSLGTGGGSVASRSGTLGTLETLAFL